MFAVMWNHMPWSERAVKKSWDEEELAKSEPVHATEHAILCLIEVYV
jgi:hypothetical protein